jgi:hypothetical protein
MHKGLAVGVVTIALCLPALALGAGFAKDPLFLSRTPVTEGQSVRVYAVISNTSAETFTGTLVFYDEKVKIGSSNISLAVGATQTASVSWTPSAGSHAVNAQLVASDGTVTEHIAKTFTINQKSQEVSAFSSAQSQTAATIDSSKDIQKSIANVSPQVAGAAAPVFTIIDGSRNAIADTLDSQIAATKKKVAAAPKPGIVAGDSTENTFKDAQLQNPTTGFWYWLYTAYLYILQALRWLVGNAGVFYPVLAIAFLYLLFRMYRRFRRPSWQR